MGLENRIVYHLVDIIEGGCRIKQALIRDKRYPKFVSSSIRADERQDKCFAGTNEKADRAAER